MINSLRTAVALAASLFANNDEAEMRGDDAGALWVRVRNVSADALGIVDACGAIIACGSATAGASAVIATGMTGAGYLTVKNIEASGGKTMYVGPGAASAASFPLLPGESLTFRFADVTTAFVYGTGGTLGWMFFR